MNHLADYSCQWIRSLTHWQLALKLALLPLVFCVIAIDPLQCVAEPLAASVTADAVAGKPFGVGVVRLKFEPMDRPRFQADQTLQIFDEERRVLYPAFQIHLEESGEPSTDKPIQRRLEALDAFFLFSGDAPSEITIVLDSEILATHIQIDVQENVTNQPALLDQWWTVYQQPLANGFNEQEAYVRNYLKGMLARRLRLDVAEPLSDTRLDESELEQYFEKATVMMFGFVSVNKAIGDTTWTSYSSDDEAPATKVLPESLDLPSVQVPEFDALPVEELAMRVPDDCLYMRCRNIDNFLWFRDFLTSWGGNLNQVVAERTSDAGVRQRLETQLGLIVDDECKRALQSNLDDLGLIAADPFFEDGAAVGVLFQASDSGPLEQWIQDCRTRVAQKTGAQATATKIAGQRVSLLSSGDQRVRSYLATDDQFILVSNSAHLVERFFEVGRGQGSLGATEEFRYARSQCRVGDDQTALLYLSDPFFRRLSSPQYRIELSRRQRAAHELRYTALAQLAARAEQAPAETVADLINGGFLPSGFGRRGDGSEPVLEDGEPRDSVRGINGTFIPIADLPVTTATSREVIEFRDFADNYRREWRATDPVVVLIAHEPTNNGREIVRVSVKITPYARASYARLASYLAPATVQRVVSPDTDLLSLCAFLLRGNGDTFTLHAGLEDADIEFTVHNGNVQILTPEVNDSFAKSYTYFAYRDGSMKDLLVVREVLQALGLETEDGAGASEALVLLELLPQLDLLRPAGLVRRILPFSGGAVPDTPFDMVSDNWRVVARMKGVGDSASKELQIVDSPKEAQARLQVQQIDGKKVEPYLQAYCYMQARRASAQNAQLLNTVAQQFHVKAAEASDVIANTLGARLVCPLNGDYEVQEVSTGHGYWVSTKWTQRSLFDESTTPEDYRFPFLKWLKGMELLFRMDTDTLHADLDLVVQPSRDE